MTSIGGAVFGVAGFSASVLGSLIGLDLCLSMEKLGKRGFAGRAAVEAFGQSFPCFLLSFRMFSLWYEPSFTIIGQDLFVGDDWHFFFSFL